jgi:hypothetical protein
MMGQFERSYATVEYDRTTGAVIGRLLEFAEGEAFKEYMEALIETTRDTGSNKMLADTSQFESALTQEDQAWSVQDWAPRAEDAGIEYMALVMPEAVVAQMSVDSVVEMADDSIERALFDDVDEAKAWLRKQ